MVTEVGRQQWLNSHLWYYICRRARNYLRVSDVTAAANSDGVAMGDDDYVILNGDLSFYVPPPTGSDPAAGVGVPGRCAPWLGTLNPDERTVFVELDASLRDRYDVITCTVQATGSRLHHKVRRRENVTTCKGCQAPMVAQKDRPGGIP